MRRPFLFAAILAAAVWPSEARLTLVSAAAIVVEALPFVLAGVLAERVVGRRNAFVAYAGCGCVAGPSARSLPAAALAWLAFGPLVALARVAAATIVDRVRRVPATTCCMHPSDLINELERLVPFAVAAAIGGQIAGRLDLAHANVALQIATGAAMGFVASPCAIGSIAVASALRAHAGAAAAAFLCVAGIVDLHALRRDWAPVHDKGDAFAYAILAIGAGLVAYRHGAQLIRPSFAPVVAACAAAAAVLAFARRSEPARRWYAAPAAVVLGALVATPPPVYRATETTLAEVFPGEHLSFTGELARDRRAAALVRYAIVCCRADAAPVVVRLARPTSLPPGTWARADGVIVATPQGFALSDDRITPVRPPADPFLYR
ncbi:MAG TPA: hypothetical protein VGG89_11525 [Candidatus Baltobacteraceae bacterium]